MSCQLAPYVLHWRRQGNQSSAARNQSQIENIKPKLTTKSQIMDVLPGPKLISELQPMFDCPAPAFANAL